MYTHYIHLVILILITSQEYFLTYFFVVCQCASCDTLNEDSCTCIPRHYVFLIIEIKPSHFYSYYAFSSTYFKVLNSVR